MLPKVFISGWGILIFGVTCLAAVQTDTGSALRMPCDVPQLQIVAVPNGRLQVGVLCEKILQGLLFGSEIKSS